jgi:hypothetical protein
MNSTVIVYTPESIHRSPGIWWGQNHYTNLANQSGGLHVTQTSHRGKGFEGEAEEDPHIKLLFVYRTREVTTERLNICSLSSGKSQHQSHSEFFTNRKICQIYKYYGDNSTDCHLISGIHDRLKIFFEEDITGWK